jgi:hypothetical protein
MHRWLKRDYLTAIVSIIIFYIVPDMNFTGKMIGFLWLGYFYQKYQDRISDKVLCIVSLVVMLASWLFWSPDYTYTELNKYSVHYLHFFMMGASSALFWVTLLRMLLHTVQTSAIHIIASIGTMTLGIYCTQEYFYLKPFFGFIFELFPPNFMPIYILWSVVILAVCCALVKLLQKNRYTALFFLGQKLK